MLPRGDALDGWDWLGLGAAEIQAPTASMGKAKGLWLPCQAGLHCLEGFVSSVSV